MNRPVEDAGSLERVELKSRGVRGGKVGEFMMRMLHLAFGFVVAFALAGAGSESRATTIDLDAKGFLLDPTPLLETTDAEILNLLDITGFFDFSATAPEPAVVSAEDTDFDFLVDESEPWTLGITAALGTVDGDTSGPMSEVSIMTDMMEILFTVTSSSGTLLDPGTSHILAVISGPFGDAPFADEFSSGPLSGTPVEMAFFQVAAPAIPLPATGLLLLSGFGAMIAARRRRAKS